MIRFVLLSSMLITMSVAWTMTGTSVSGFHGAVLMHRMPSTTTTTTSSSLTMKKGKSNVPMQMRGQYKKAQELSQMRKEMIAASQAGDDGLPVFNLFVRSKRANVSFFSVDCVCLRVCQSINRLINQSTSQSHLHLHPRCGTPAAVSKATTAQPP